MRTLPHKHRVCECFSLGLPFLMEGFTLNSLSKQVKDKLDSKQFSINGKSTVQALVYLLHIILASILKDSTWSIITPSLKNLST